MRPLTWLLAAPRVVGPAKPLPEGPLLIVANHVTAYDGPLIVYALPGPFRRRIAAAMVGEMLDDLPALAQSRLAAGTQGLLPPRAARLLAGHGALQCLSAAPPARLPGAALPTPARPWTAATT